MIWLDAHLSPRLAVWITGSILGRHLAPAIDYLRAGEGLVEILSELKADKARVEATIRDMEK